MKKQLFTLKVIVISFITTITFAQTGINVQKYDLNYKMKNGKEFTFISLGYGNKYTKNHDSLKSRNRELVQDYRVLSSNENSTIFELEYKKMVFNDKNSKGENTTTNFSPLIGKKVRYTISSKGEMSNFEGFNELPDITYPSGTMTGDIHRQEITHMFPIFSKKPVAIGESWSRKEFGFIIEYKLLNEMKFNGYDCVRIFAQMNLEQSSTKGKDANGMDYIRESTIPYSDIYYFAYKEGMIIYRFSVASCMENIYKTTDNVIFRHNIRDQLWEEHIIFK